MAAVLILNGYDVPEILGPQLARSVDDHILAGHPVDHVLSELGAHGVVVPREPNTNQIVIVVCLIGMVEMVDVEHPLPGGDSRFDPPRAYLQAIHLNPAAGIVDRSDPLRSWHIDYQAGGL